MTTTAPAIIRRSKTDRIGTILKQQMRGGSQIAKYGSFQEPDLPVSTPTPGPTLPPLNIPNVGPTRQIPGWNGWPRTSPIPSLSPTAFPSPAPSPFPSPEPGISPIPSPYDDVLDVPEIIVTGRPVGGPSGGRSPQVAQRDTSVRDRVSRFSNSPDIIDFGHGMASNNMSAAELEGRFLLDQETGAPQPFGPMYGVNNGRVPFRMNQRSAPHGDPIKYNQWLMAQPEYARWKSGG